MEGKVSGRGEQTRYIIYIHLIFKESISKKIFTMFSIWIFSTITFYFAITVAKLFSNVDVNYIQKFVLLFRIFVQISLLLALYFWISNSYKKLLNVIPDKTILLMSLYPFLAFLILINNYTGYFGLFKNFNKRLDYNITI